MTKYERDEPIGDHVADASTAHALADVFDDEESEAALNALGTKLNSVIHALENAGILKTA